MNESSHELQALLEHERAARSEIERAGRLKDEFLEALGHELRAPLNSILGWSRLMELGRLDAAEIQSGGQTIARNARLLANLVDDLLDLSAITSGKIRVDPEETDMCEIVEAAIDILQPAAGDKGVQVRKDFDKPDCLVFGDPHRLQQVTWHLLSNAIKFTPRGGVALVSVKCDGSHCEIAVTDTGAGIASEMLPFVFDRFWRSDAADQRHAGLGLGLALAKRLVELHGGTVTASSGGSNQGSTFTVVLPRVAPRIADSASTSPTAAPIDALELDLSDPDLPLHD
ncbi:MAG TPA: HAMP domain-containing sensor histidine kinase [Steroidobacteraceae bacterium]